MKPRVASQTRDLGFNWKSSETVSYSNTVKDAKCFHMVRLTCVVMLNTAVFSVCVCVRNLRMYEIF